MVPYRTQLKASFDKPLVQAPQAILRGWKGEENLLGYWVADVMRERATVLMGRPVRFGITNSGGIRANLRPATRLRRKIRASLRRTIPRRAIPPRVMRARAATATSASTPRGRTADPLRRPPT